MSTLAASDLLLAVAVKSGFVAVPSGHRDLLIWEEGWPALDLHDLRWIRATRLKSRWNAGTGITV